MAEDTHLDKLMPGARGIQGEMVRQKLRPKRLYRRANIYAKKGVGVPKNLL